MSVSVCSKKSFKPAIVMGVMMGMLQGCASLDYGVPAPLRTTKNVSVGVTQLDTGNPDSLVGGNGALTKTGRAEVSPIPQSSRPRSGIFGADKENGAPERGELTLNVSGLPLPAFINEVFGNVLGKNFVISGLLKAKKDLVTLRVSEPQSAASLYRMASSVLKEYGVGIEENEALLTFVMLRGGAAGNKPPLLVTGKALPETPSSHRPVFYYHMLKVVSPNDARRWLIDAYGNTGLTVQGEASQSMLLLRGTLDAVRQASDALEYLDRPFMRGRISSRITPAFVDAPKLATEIATILKAQGYDIRVGGLGGAIQLLPLTITNSMLVFANDKSSLALIERWVRELDQPRVESAASTDNVGLYYYPVQNALAEEIMETVEPIIKTLTKHGGKDDGAEPIVIDKNQNALLLNVSPKEWVRILPVLKAMDKPTRQVMVEVTLASYKLTNNESYGADWSLNSEGGGSSRALSLTSTGINYVINKHGDSAVFSALIGNSKVDILSTPRVLVKSGESATINVGSQVPVVSSRQTNADGEVSDVSSNVLTSVEYRTTGTLLTVQPVVLSGNRVDLTIAQQLSNTAGSGVGGSPIIEDVSVSTSLTLSDGGSVLLGGLIRDSFDEGNNGVPFLKDIPWIGWLFAKTTKEITREELLILIRPYVIDANEGAEEVTQAFRTLLSSESSGSLVSEANLKARNEAKKGNNAQKD